MYEEYEAQEGNLEHFDGCKKGIFRLHGKEKERSNWKDGICGSSVKKKYSIKYTEGIRRPSEKIKNSVFRWERGI